MNKLFAILSIIFLTIQPASGDDKLLGIALAIHAADYRQTLDIKNHQGYYELNPVLGRNPSDSKVHAYMIGAGVLIALISKWADEYLDNSEMIDYMFIANGLVSVTNNKSIRLRVLF